MRSVFKKKKSAVVFARCESEGATGPYRFQEGHIFNEHRQDRTRCEGCSNKLGAMFFERCKFEGAPLEEK